MSASQQQHPPQQGKPGHSKEDILAALSNADSHIHDIQALLQSSGDPSPLQLFGEELLPVVLAACDVTTPQGQSRKLAALNTLWKALLSIVTSPAISQHSFTEGTQFMLAQLWHGVFSHDWTDARRTRLAAFFASHLASAVRAHPDWALASPLCEGILDAFLAVAEAVASGSDAEGAEAGSDARKSPDGSSVASRAKSLYTTVLVRLAGIVECLGSCSASTSAHGAAAPGDRHTAGGNEEEEEENGAATTDAASALHLLERCCSCGAAAAALPTPTLSKPASSLFLSSPSSTALSAPPASAKAADASAAVVQAIASLGCSLHAVKGLLHRLQELGHTGTSARSLEDARLVLLTLLQWLPGVPLLSTSDRDGSTPARLQILLDHIRTSARNLPTGSLWLATRASGEGAGDCEEVQEASLRTMWTEGVAAALSLLCENSSSDREEPMCFAARAVLAVLATPHSENTVLMTESLVQWGRQSAAHRSNSSTDASPVQGVTALLSQLCRVGSILCAQAQRLAGGEGEQKGLQGSLAPEAASAMWDAASAVAVALGCFCAVVPLPDTAAPPSSLVVSSAQRRPRYGQYGIDGGCFIALADSVFFAIQQDTHNAAGVDEPTAEEEEEVERGEARCRHAPADDALQLAVELEHLLADIIESASADPLQGVRLLQVAPLLCRLRRALDWEDSFAEHGQDSSRRGRNSDGAGGGGEGRDSAAARAILRHRIEQRKQRCGGKVNPLSPMATTPSPVSPPPALSPASSMVAASCSAFHAVLRSFSSTLSTLTRVLTAEASQPSSPGRALLASVVAAALVREASFFPLEEPQDQLLTACIRRWVDLSFLLTSSAPQDHCSMNDPDAAEAKVQAEKASVLALARHNAARSLMCFVEHNTNVSMEQLRLPETAAVSLMRLLQGASPEPQHAASATAAELAALLSGHSSYAARHQREERWAQLMERLRATQPDMQKHFLSLLSTADAEAERHLLARLLACKAALSRFLETTTAATGTAVGASPLSEEVRAKTAACLEEVLALSASAASVLRGEGGLRGSEEGAAAATGSAGTHLHKSRRLEVAGGRTPLERPSRGSGGSSDTAGQENGAAAPSRPSSSTQLLAASQISVRSQSDQLVDGEANGNVRGVEVVDIE